MAIPRDIVLALLLACAASLATAEEYNYCGAPLPGPLDAPAGLELHAVQIVTRHGDRVPCNPITNDPTVWSCPMTSSEVPSIYDGTDADASEYSHRPLLFAKTYTEGQSWAGNCMLCQLTERGAGQHRALGRALRARYGATSVLPSICRLDDELYVRATDTWRTQQSAESHILGLFDEELQEPGKVASKCGRSHRFTIPVHTRQYGNDEMVPSDTLCPKLAQIEKEIYAAPEYVAFLDKFAVLVQRMAPALNVTPGPSVNPTTVKDNAWGKMCNRMPFPVDPADYALMTDYANYDSNYSNPVQMSRLAMQPFMQTLLAHVDDVIAGRSRARYAVYSGHDSTLAPLISALSLGGNWPPYASHAIFELWRSAVASDNGDDGWSVRVLYNGQVGVLPGCPGDVCPLARVRSFVSSMVDGPRAAACAVPAADDFTAVWAVRAREWQGRMHDRYEMVGRQRRVERRMMMSKQFGDRPAQ